MTTHFPTRILVIAASVAFAALAAFASMKTLVRMPSTTIPSGTMEKTISIDIRKVRTELLAAAKSRQHDVTLDLDVEAERSPEVFYEVYLAAPNGKQHHVGNVTLFGAGIRSEAHGEFHPAHVQLVISDAVLAALRSRSAHTLNITFRAKGAEGVPPPRSASALTIDRAEIVVGPRQRE